MAAFDPIRQYHRPADEPGSTLWRSLFYFNIYRLVLSSILVVLAFGGGATTGGPHRYPELFMFGALAILALAVLYFFTINAARPPFAVQVHLQTLLDLALLTVLIYASEGIQSGFGFLMIVTVAAVSLLDTRRSAIAYAALGTLLALGETATGVFTGRDTLATLQTPGFLGVGLFTTALLVSQLSQRIRISEETVLRRESAIADLNALNREIVELIPTGALAVDNDERIVVCNGRARTLLNLDDNPEGRTLAEVSPALASRLAAADAGAAPISQEIPFQGNTVHISTESFEGGRLLFLEDLSREREQARQTRLAALGRLAAAIAHEIRNPLSAVYQSAQLLGETGTLAPEEANIAGIIRKQSERIERIVASVLVVSRGDTGNPETLELTDWLTRFRRHFVTEHGLPAGAITIAGEPTVVNMDPGHLGQVLTNLCENAIAHSKGRHGELVRLECRAGRGDNAPTLEVIDHGTGITEQHRRQLFEPFFTTRSLGTGLGLYISRELCEANHAQLTHENDRDGTVFRITFHERPKAHAQAGTGR